MPIKTERVEFRCDERLKARLLTLRPSLKAATLSAVIRSLAEAAVENPGGVSYSFSAPALREIKLHLSRIAAALQRCLLTGTPASDQR